jgi:outer membrane protein assembly factor BamB
VVAALTLAAAGRAADQPQWGQRHSRNMVSDEKGLSETFDAGTRTPSGEIELPPGSHVRWVARLGNASYGTPVVAGGRVFVGTNNEAPRDPRLPGDRGVLMCFDEQSGRFLWQLCLPKESKIKWSDWYYIGITSPPTVEGDRAYLVSNRGEALCLDVRGWAAGSRGPFADQGRLMAGEGQPPLTPGAKDADILWLLDMPARLNVTPHNGSNGSVLIDGELLYVSTSQGVDWTHHSVAHPEAPSLVVLDKRTGAVVARDDFGIGPDITHGSWSSPALGQVGPRKLVFYGGGNGWLYACQALEGPPPDGPPLRLVNVWRFNGNPVAQSGPAPPPDHQHDSTSYEVTAMPVFHNRRVYAYFTQEAFHGMKRGFLACIDATKTGDVTRSGLLWSYDKIGSGPSTVAVADGLVYAADYAGKLHCLDADTGQCCWEFEAGVHLWGSPLVADGKVYLSAGDKQALWVLTAGRQLKVRNSIHLRDHMYASPTAANGVLFVATNKHLYAVAGP